MDKVRELVAEVINEMDNMSKKEIESFEEEWIININIRQPERKVALERLVHIVCNTGIIRAEKRIKIA